jgi:predicted nucleic acid-binding Zn ribbon protein
MQTRKPYQPRNCQTCESEYVPTGGYQKFCPACTSWETIRSRQKIARIRANPEAYAVWAKQKRDNQRAHRVRIGAPVRPVDRTCGTCGTDIPAEVHANVRYCSEPCRKTGKNEKERQRQANQRNRDREALNPPRPSADERARVLLGGCLGCRHSLLENGVPRCAIKRLLACDPNGPRGPKLKEAI